MSTKYRPFCLGPNVLNIPTHNKTLASVGQHIIFDTNTLTPGGSGGYIDAAAENNGDGDGGGDELILLLLLVLLIWLFR